MGGGGGEGSVGTSVICGLHIKCFVHGVSFRGHNCNSFTAPFSLIDLFPLDHTLSYKISRF